VEIRALKTADEIRKEIKGEWGDYETYRKAQSIPVRPILVETRQTPTAAPEKSESELNVQYLECLAKAAGLPLSEFCARYPDVYRRYQQLSYAG
jgi:hypothetical protein